MADRPTNERRDYYYYYYYYYTTCACGQDVDVLGVLTQKCRLDGNLTNSTYNRLVAC